MAPYMGPQKRRGSPKMRKKARRRPPLSMTTLCFDVLHEMRLTDGDEENPRMETKSFFGCLGRVTVPLMGGSTLHPKGCRSEMSYSETRLPLRERFCHAQFGRSLSL